MATKVKELRSILAVPEDDPNCSICHRRPDRRYMDDIWRSALARYETSGPTRVECGGGKR